MDVFVNGGDVSFAFHSRVLLPLIVTFNLIVLLVLIIYTNRMLNYLIIMAIGRFT